MILVCILYLIFSLTTFVNSKLTLTNSYPFLIATLRAFGSGVFLLSYSLLMQKNDLKYFSLPKHGWTDLILFGVLVHGFVMCSFSYAIQYTDPIKICFLFAMSPFITVLFEYFLRTDILTSKKIAGLAIGLLGLVPILLDVSPGAYKNIPFHLEVFGVVVIFVSTFFFAYGWIVMKRFLTNFPDHPMVIVNGTAMLLGGGFSFLVFLIFSKGNAFPIVLTAEFPWLMIAFIGSGLITYMIYPYLLKTYTVTFIAFAGFLEPVFGLFYGVVFMQHQITLLSCLAITVLFIGLYIFYKEEIKHRKFI